MESLDRSESTVSARRPALSPSSGRLLTSPYWPLQSVRRSSAKWRGGSTSGTLPRSVPPSGFCQRLAQAMRAAACHRGRQREFVSLIKDRRVTFALLQPVRGNNGS